MAEKFWMIVNITQVWYLPCNMDDDFELPDRCKKPRYCYTIRKKAEQELFRLRTKQPYDEFVLLEAVGEVVKGPNRKLSIREI